MRKISIPFCLATAVLSATAGLAPATAQSWTQQAAADTTGNTRLLMVFSPDSRNLAFRKQYALLEHHNLELTRRDTVVVPFLGLSRKEDTVFIGENLPADNTAEQALARSRYHVKPADFAVILIDKDGQEQLRWVNPISIREFIARVDPQAAHTDQPAALHRDKPEGTSLR